MIGVAQTLVMAERVVVRDLSNDEGRKLQTIHFVTYGNAWCEVLRPELRALSQASLLEATLLHFRCIIEFLGDEPATDRVMARDYLDDWDWKVTGNLRQVRDLHGRLAHLGTVRRSVSTSGDFSWRSWLLSEAPAVLRSFRDFLVRLRESSPRRFTMFVQPRDGLPAIDLVAAIDAIVAPGRE